MFRTSRRSSQMNDERIASSYVASASRADAPRSSVRHAASAARPHLRVLAPQPEPIERGAREMTLRPFGEDRHARGDVGAGLEVRELLAGAAPAAVAGPHAEHAAPVDEQLLGGRLRKDRHAE